MKKIQLFFLFAIFLFNVFCFSRVFAKEIEADPIYLKVGQLKTLPKKNIGSVELSQNAAVRIVRSAFDTLSLQGLHKGEGVLKILWLNRKSPTFVKVFVTEKGLKKANKQSQKARTLKISQSQSCERQSRIHRVGATCGSQKLEIPGWETN